MVMVKVSNVVKRCQQWFIVILSNPLYFWIIAALIYVLSRLATWGYPFDSDHWIFYYVGKAWADGGQLYIDAWDHKPPLIFAFNAIMYGVAGGNLVLHRVWLTGISVVTCLLFYVLVKKLVPYLFASNPHYKQDSTMGHLLPKIALLLFIFFTNLSQFASSGNNTENYGLLFLVGMWLAMYMFFTAKRWWYMAAAGICLSVLFFLKGTFLLFGLPLWIGLAIIYHKRLVKLVGWSALFVAPLIVQAIGWIVYFTQQGTFQDFITASFSFSAHYANSAWHGGVSNEPILLAETLLMIAISVVCFVAFLRDVKHGYSNVPYVVTAATYIVGLAAVLSVGSFYPYYLQIIMPLIVILGVYAFVRVRLQKTVRVVAIAAAIVTAVLLYGVSMKQFLNNFTGGASIDARENQQVARYIRANTTPQDKIFDDGYGATLYQMADRQSGTRFVSASVLLLDYRDRYGYNLDGIFICDMEKNKTAYVVMSIDSDLYTKNKPVTDYITSHYQFEKAFDTLKVMKRKAE